MPSHRQNTGIRQVPFRLMRTRESLQFTIKHEHRESTGDPEVSVSLFFLRELVVAPTPSSRGSGPGAALWVPRGEGARAG